MKSFQNSSFDKRLSSDEVLLKLAGLDSRLRETMKVLLEFSDVLQVSILPVVLSSASNRKKIQIRCGKRKAVEICARLAHSTTHRQKPEKILSLIDALKLPRNVFVTILFDFEKATRGYLALSREFFMAGEKIRSGNFKQKEAFWYSEISRRMSAIEATVKTNRAYLHGLIKHIREAITYYTETRNSVLEGNLSLCYMRARTFSKTPSEFKDNYQQGVFGLARAFDLYVPGKVPFDKYAFYWVNQAIGDKVRRPNIVEFKEAIDEYSEEEKEEKPETDVSEFLLDLSKVEKLIIALSFGIYEVLRKEVSQKAILREKRRQSSSTINKR